MKNIGFLAMMAVILCLYNCEKEKDKEKTTSLNYAEIVYGGCNNTLEKSIRYAEENDTVMVFIESDTLTVHVGINYICCAHFEGKSESIDDTLQITVSDTCSPDDNCYCHCMCYYTFDFHYTDLETGDYPCNVRLWDAREETYKMLFQGTISISLNKL